MWILTEDAIDARAPRVNQAVIAVLALGAVTVGPRWLLALRPLSFAPGLTVGRRWCVASAFY